MNTFLLVLAVGLGIVGIIGSVVPGLPGPPLSWCGLLVAFLRGGAGSSGEPMTTNFLILWLVITTLVTVADYVVPAWFTKLTGGSRYASWGAIAGLFIGMFLTPAGVILGSLAGAFAAELLFAQKSPVTSLKSAFGAFVGFLFGTGIKLLASGVMMYYIVVYL